MKKTLKIIGLSFFALFVFGWIFGLVSIANIYKTNANSSNTFESFSAQFKNLLTNYGIEDFEEISFNLDDELTTVNNTLMVKGDLFKNSTGAKISNDYENEYTIKNNETSISLTLNDNIVFIDNEDDICILNQPAEKIDNDLYIPIEDISRTLGYELRFDDNYLFLDRPYATKRIIVKSCAKLDSCGAVATVEGYNNLHIYQYATEKATIEACEYFGNLSNIDWYQVDNIITPQNIENENSIFGFGDSYSYSSWGADSMGVESYSNYLINTIGTSNLNDVVIAVLDTGIDTDHSWFENRIATGGRNFSSSTSSTAYEYEDVYGHGTHVAGIICDLTLSNVKILPIKVMNDQGYGYSSQIMLGINYVNQLKTNGMNICAMNLSLGNSSAYIGSDEYNMYQEALGIAYNKGILPVVAAGNDGANVIGTAPANIDCAITVAAVGKSGSLYYHPSWSNYGNFIDVSAPGYNIVSAKVGGGSVSMSGTSMATPHIAAAVALLMSDSNNNYTIHQIENLLDVNTIDLGEEGWDKYFGEGMVNIEYAYAELISDVIFSNINTDCTNSFNLTLSCSTVGASIYYTTDGTIPSITNGTLYTMPITVDKTQIIKARAYVITSGDVVKYSKVSQITYCFYGQDLEGAFTVSSSGVLTAYNGILTTVTVPIEVNGITITSIGANAFTSSSVTQVTLPSTVTKIGQSAFTNCSSIECVYGPNVTLIDMYAFNDCSAFQYVTDAYFPKLKSIGKYAFCRCFNLRPIVLSNVEFVDYWAFSMKRTSESDPYPTYLTSLTLPSATIISDGAFIFCEYLTSINIPNVEIIASDAFRECDLVNIDLPEVKYLGTHAFYVNENLLTVNMPNVLVVGAQCFYYYCKSLSSVIMPKVQYICFAAFRECFALTSLDMPEVEKIGSWAFYDCNNLVSINVPKLRYIQYVAFGSCDSLTEVNLPSVITIGGGAFRMNNNITKVTLSSCLENILDNSFGVNSSCVFYYYSGTAADEYLSSKTYAKIDLATNNSIFTYEIHDDKIYITGCVGVLSEDIIIPSYINGLPVTKICANAFENCLYITSLSVSYLTEIEEEAFKGCLNLESIYLTRIEKINESAFKNCVALNQIYIEDISYVGDEAFYGCSNLLSVKLNKNIEYIGINAFGYSIDDEIIPVFVIYGYEDTVAKTYADSKNITFRAMFSNLEHYYYNTYVNSKTGHTEIYISFVDKHISGNIILPSQYNGMTISKIGAAAFEECSLITGIILPSSITTIAKGAFYGCYLLENINFDYVQTLEESVSGYGTFRDCGLTSVYLPNITFIPSGTFHGCEFLREIYAPLVTEIGATAFYSCTSLKTVYMPNLEIINESAFCYNYQLSSITTNNIKVLGTNHILSNGNKTIIGSVFTSCTSLKEMYLPKIVTIGLSTFFSSSITKVVIGKGFENYYSVPIDSSITIYGYSETLAETYANSNGNTFVAIDEFEMVSNLPNSVTKGLNTICNLSVNVNGFELKYQWYTTLSNSTADGLELYGETSSILNVDTSSAGINKYFVKITNWDGEEIISNICSVTVSGEVGTYTTTASSGSNGSITPSGSVIVNEGDDQAFTFSANTGYHVSAIVVDGVALTGTDLTNAINNGYTFSNVSDYHTISVEFAINTYTIIVTQVPNGNITPSGVINANYGEQVIIIITPNNGYEVAKLVVDGNNITTGDLSSYTFTNITENHIITAEFTAIANIGYIVNHWQEALDTDGAFYYGGKYYKIYETETFSGPTNSLTNANAKNYNGFTSLTFNQEVISANENTIVNIYYTRNSYTLILVGTTGIINILGSGTYLFGENVTISAELLEGYDFIAWKSANLGFNDIYTLTSTFTMPNESVTLTATANITTYTDETDDSIPSNTNIDNKTIKYIILGGIVFVGITSLLTISIVIKKKNRIYKKRSKLTQQIDDENNNENIFL